MLDTFMNLTGSAKQRQADELQALITSAKEERSALSAMLTQISVRSSKLSQIGKTLEQVGQKADAASTMVDELHKKVTGFDDRLKAFDLVDKRIDAVVGQLTEVQKAAEKLTATDGELQKHRQAMNSLASQALETQATIETVRRERATLEDLRSTLRQASADVKQSIDGASALKAELESVRTTTTGLNQDYARIREASREAREDAAAATENVKEIEKKHRGAPCLAERARRACVAQSEVA